MRCSMSGLAGNMARTGMALVLFLPFVLSFIPASTEGSLAFEQDRLINLDVGTAVQDRSDIAISGSDVYIVWQDKRSGNWDIFSRASHDGGMTFGPEVRVDDTGSNTPVYDDTSQQEEPSVDVDEGGRVHIVWQDDREGRALIYYSRSSDRGATFSANMPVSVHSVGRQLDPDLSLSPEGDIGITWEDDRAKSSYTQIYVSTAPAGSSFSTGVRASDTALNKICVDPAITLPGKGRLHIAWADNRNNNSDIYMSSSANLGSSFGKSVSVSRDTSETEQEMPTIGSNSTHIYVAWKDPRGGGGDIYYGCSVDNGASFSKDKCIHSMDTAGYQYEPQIKMGWNGSVYFTWTTAPGLSDSKSDIRMTVLAPNGTVEDIATVNEPLLDTSQDKPAIGVSGSGKAIIAWTDNRRGNKDIYMTRTTESGQLGSAPRISDERVNPGVGVVGTRFTFAMAYSDQENDPPASGYPCVELFYKGIGGDLIEYPGSPFSMNMRMVPAPDFDYRNGETFLFMLEPDRAVELFHRFAAKASRGNTTTVRTELVKGPLLDAAGPTFGRMLPRSDEWQLNNIVQLSIDISDDLSGVDPWSVYYQVYNPGTGTWEPWQRKGDSFPTGDLSVNYRVNVTFMEGKTNLVRFRAKDMMGNGAPGTEYMETQAFPVWVDVSGPLFQLIDPPPGNVLDDPRLELTIRLRDAGIGIDPSKVEVSYSIAGTEAYGPWNDLGEIKGFIEENPDLQGEYLAHFNLSFQFGYSNYVKVRAFDMLGNDAISDDLQFTILERDDTVKDRPPSLVVSVQPRVSGSVRPHITWSQSFDPDGDLVTYYLRILEQTTLFPVVDWTHISSGDTYFDPPEDVMLSPGRSYIVQMVPSSVSIGNARLNGSLTNSTITISTDANTPPTPVTSITPRATSELMPVIRWEPSQDVNNDPIYYFIRMGSFSGGSDITDWVSLLNENRYSVPRPLGVGVYYIDILCSDGKDFSPISHFTLSKGIFSPHVETERTTIVLYQGNSTTVQVKLTNKGFAFDYMDLELSGPAVTVPTMDCYLADQYIELSAFSSKNTTLHIETSQAARPGIYILNITARSTDGVSGYTKTVSIRIVDPRNIEGTPSEGDGEDAREKLDRYVIYALLVLMVLIILAMLYGYYRIDKGQREEQVEIVPVKQAKRRDIPPPSPVMEMGSGKGEKPELPPKKGKKTGGPKRRKKADRA